LVATIPSLRGPTRPFGYAQGRHKTAQKRKSGRSGRDDGIRKEKTQEHSQEWLCHMGGVKPRLPGDEHRAHRQECLCHMDLWSGGWTSKLVREMHRTVA
jgi:hypothetical protein